MNIIKNNPILWVIILLFAQFSTSCRVISNLTATNNGSTSNSSVNSSKNATSGDNTGKDTPVICQNTYYPVGANIERKYHIDYQKAPVPDQDYTERYTDFNGDGFVAKTEFKEVSTTINWRCTADGLLATQYGNSIDMKSGSSAKIDTTNSKGVSFPVESRWKTGEKWSSKYDIKETLKNPNGSPLGGGDGTVSQASEVIGSEEVKVAAGTFQTIKVKNQTTLNITVKVGGMSVPTKTVVETTAWFAKDVGMVKSETNMGGMGGATTELISFKK